jgi:hypothetical protein
MKPTPQLPFPPESVNQVLDLVTWGLIVFGAIWLVTAIIGAMHRRAYNLTHAESGRSKNIQPDFLKVDKEKREAAIDRGEQFDRKLAKPAAPGNAVGSALTLSRIAASASALIGLLFTAVTTMQRVGSTDQTIRELGSWETLKAIVSEHQVGAILCIAVIAANAYIVVRKMQKSDED